MHLSDLLLKIISPNAKFVASRDEVPVNPVRERQYKGPAPDLQGLFVVAAFDTVSKSPLQNFGRQLYYRDPERFHFLLPYLGHRQKPGAPQPGRQPRQSAKPGLGG